VLIYASVYLASFIKIFKARANASQAVRRLTCGDSNFSCYVCA